jgi:hypothetical protein
MCLVIDANCFSLVFGRKHTGFTPVMDWIDGGKGRMIYGGKKYFQELKDWKMLGVVKELRTARKAVHVSDTQVDSIADALKLKVHKADFDDEHILALVIVSRCRVVCTNDKRAMPYLKDRALFAVYAGLQRPKIFTGDRRHAAMCGDHHVVAACL